MKQQVGNKHVGEHPIFTQSPTSDLLVSSDEDQLIVEEGVDAEQCEQEWHCKAPVQHNGESIGDCTGIRHRNPVLGSAGEEYPSMTSGSTDM